MGIHTDMGCHSRLCIWFGRGFDFRQYIGSSPLQDLRCLVQQGILTFALGFSVLSSNVSFIGLVIAKSE